VRIANISTIEEANDFLPEFIERFNKRFAVKPAESRARLLACTKRLKFNGMH